MITTGNQYPEIIKSLEEYDGRSWEGQYELEWKGEKLTIEIETNLQIIHENRRTGRSTFGSEWDWESTGKVTYKDGDRWKINYYIDQNSPNLMKLLDSQIESEAGNILLFLKDEMLGVLEWLDYKGVKIKESE